MEDDGLAVESESEDDGLAVESESEDDGLAVESDEHKSEEDGLGFVVARSSGWPGVSFVVTRLSDRLVACEGATAMSLDG